jgi:general secretion pathway protein H
MRRPRDDRARTRRSLQYGFTLIELLVVLLIIGILASFVGLNISGTSAAERLDTEAARLEQILKLALEEAEIKGVQVGFRHTREGYEFLVPGEDGQWTVVDDNSPLRPRPLAAPYALQLRVEGRIVPPAVERELDADQPLQPQFLLLSSGEVMPFLLWLTYEKKQEAGFIIQGELTGGIRRERWTRETWTGNKRRS